MKKGAITDTFVCANTSEGFYTMQNEIMTFCSRDELKNIFIEGMREYEAQKAALIAIEQTFSINEVAKRLNRSHATIVKLIREGILVTTSDQRRVTAISVNNYLISNKAK